LCTCIIKGMSDFVSDTLHANDSVRITAVPFGGDARTVEQERRTLLDALDMRIGREVLQWENGLPVSGLSFKPACAEDRDTKLVQTEKRTMYASNTLRVPFRVHLDLQSERPEFEDRANCWFPEHDLRIGHRRSGNDWAQVTEESQGRRSAALLAFPLAFADQPPDREIRGGALDCPSLPSALDS